MTSVNFTASVDRDLLRRVKVLAAMNNTSVSALLNGELRYLVETCEQADRLGNSNAATLLAFCLGRISDVQAMAQLELEHEEDLFWPRPTCPCRACPSQPPRRWWLSWRPCRGTDGFASG
jgi:hypothetical protein